MVRPEFPGLDEDFDKIREIAKAGYEKLVEGTISSLEGAGVTCHKIGAHAAVMSLVVGLIVPTIYGGVRDNQNPEAAELWLLATLEDVRAGLKGLGVDFDYKLGVKRG